MSFTDFNQQDFECGRYKSRSEINQGAEVAEAMDTDGRKTQCGATIINDR